MSSQVLRQGVAVSVFPINVLNQTLLFLTTCQDCDNAISAGGLLGLGLGTDCQQPCTGNTGEACGSLGVLGLTLARMSVYEYIVSGFHCLCAIVCQSHVSFFIHGDTVGSLENGIWWWGGKDKGSRSIGRDMIHNPSLLYECVYTRSSYILSSLSSSSPPQSNFMSN